jgi:hypothetical protein
MPVGTPTLALDPSRRKTRLGWTAMGATHEERLARNEVFFRGLNERILDAAAVHGTDDHVYEFVCECADPSCAERISLTTAEYERIRADGTRFVLAAGHDVASIENVVAEKGDHVVVEKLGLAAEIAQVLDPRAGLNPA